MRIESKDDGGGEYETKSKRQTKVNQSRVFVSRPVTTLPTSAASERPTRNRSIRSRLSHIFRIGRSISVGNLSVRPAAT